MKFLKKIITITVFSILTLSSCQDYNNNITTAMTNKKEFSYATTASAPKGYGIEVYYGLFMDENGEIIAAIPRSGVEYKSWQYDGSKGVQGGHIVPSHIEYVYLSLIEKKFYKVDADLPRDKMLKYFQEGYTLWEERERDEQGNYAHSTYNKITVGAAPGGVIVVWLSGKFNRVEICRLQAEEVFVDKNKFSERMGYNYDPKETQEAFFDYNYDYMIFNGKPKLPPPYGLWDKYRKRYKYRYVLDSYKEEGDYLKGMESRHYNGEAFWINYNPELCKEYREMAIPYHLRIFTLQYGARFEFDDTEMMTLFEKISKKYPEEPFEIVFKPKFMYRTYDVFVRCKGEEFPLEKCSLKSIWGKD